MFNLDQAIAEWRRQMAAGGIKIPEALDELESHLRDDIERQMRSGSDAEQAFAAAVQRIGRANILKSEFEKIGGTTWALIGLCALTMLLAARIRLWHLLVVIPPVLAAGLWFIMHKEYRWKRMIAFTNPWANPQKEGYHMIQSLLSFSTGGVTGRGLGNGIQKLGYLPEPHLNTLVLRGPTDVRSRNGDDRPGV